MFGTSVAVLVYLNRIAATRTSGRRRSRRSSRSITLAIVGFIMTDNSNALLGTAKASTRRTSCPASSSRRSSSAWSGAPSCVVQPGVYAGIGKGGPPDRRIATAIGAGTRSASRPALDSVAVTMAAGVCRAALTAGTSSVGLRSKKPSGLA